MNNNQKHRLKLIEKQISNLSGKVLSLTSSSNNFAWARLLVFTIGFVITVLSYSIMGKVPGTAVLVLSLAAFIFIVYLHYQLDKRLKRHKIWLNIKSQNAARIKLDWENIPEPVIETLTEGHPFAADLDITGKKSIFRLIDISITEDGSRTLLNWLTEREPDITKIKQRQPVIQELKDLPLFRDKLLLETFILNRNPFEKWSGKRILNWVNTDNSTGEIKKVLNIAIALLASTYLLFIFSLFLINPLFWKAAFVIYAFHFFSNNHHTKAFFRDAIAIEMELRKLNTILSRLEKFNFGKNVNMANFCEPFRRPGLEPSYYMRRIKNLVGSASIQSNPAIWIISNAIFPWDFFHGYRLKKYKTQIAEVLPLWLAKLYELEAMISLANFAYLNPDYIFPEITPSATGAPGEESKTEPVIEAKPEKLFYARQVGHPLIPPEQKVCNDFQKDQTGDVIIITGSNMAGKSTFLRTLGVNLSLAFAGGPVNALEFETKVFRIFTCIKVSDSVTDGFSYFYAEVKRLKALLDELETVNQLPLFFLVDEIFRGTNNRERLIGSRSYIHALTGKNGVGAISTHDLELIKLAETIPEISNYHFRDEIIDSKMAFDYKLHHGPCPTTNALKIMKLEGLPVED